MCAAYILPNYPATTSWLDEEEKAYASWRLLADINEEDARFEQSAWAGAKLALSDYRLYIFVAFQHISVLSQTFQYFFPAIVNTLGYGKITTLWLTAPVWVSTRIKPVPSTSESGIAHKMPVCNISYNNLRDFHLCTNQRSLDSHRMFDAHGGGGKRHRHGHYCCWSQVFCHVSDAHGRHVGL